MSNDGSETIAEHVSSNEHDTPLRVIILLRLVSLLPQSYYLDHFAEIRPYFARILGIDDTSTINEDNLPKNLFDEHAQINHEYLNPDGSINVRAIRTNMAK